MKKHETNKTKHTKRKDVRDQGSGRSMQFPTLLQHNHARWLLRCAALKSGRNVVLPTQLSHAYPALLKEAKALDPNTPSLNGNWHEKVASGKVRILQLFAKLSLVRHRTRLLSGERYMRDCQCIWASSSQTRTLPLRHGTIVAPLGCFPSVQFQTAPTARDLAEAKALLIRAFTTAW